MNTEAASKREAVAQPFDLDAACAAADERLRRRLNRSVAQHRRHLTRLAGELRRRCGISGGAS